MKYLCLGQHHSIGDSIISVCSCNTYTSVEGLTVEIIPLDTGLACEYCINPIWWVSFRFVWKNLLWVTSVYITDQFQLHV